MAPTKVRFEPQESNDVTALLLPPEIEFKNNEKQSNYYYAALLFVSVINFLLFLNFTKGRDN